MLVKGVVTDFKTSYGYVRHWLNRHYRICEHTDQFKTNSKKFCNKNKEKRAISSVYFQLQFAQEHEKNNRVAPLEKIIGLKTAWRM